MFSRARIDSAMRYLVRRCRRANASNARTILEARRAGRPGRSQVLSRLANQTAAHANPERRLVVLSPRQRASRAVPDQRAGHGDRRRSAEVLRQRDEAWRGAPREWSSEGRAASTAPARPTSIRARRARSCVPTVTRSHRWGSRSGIRSAVNFPRRSEPGADVNVAAAAQRQHDRRRVQAEGPRRPSGRRRHLATDAPGRYGSRSTIRSGLGVLGDASGKESSRRRPGSPSMVITDALVLRGPILGRVALGGLFLRADARKDRGPAARRARLRTTDSTADRLGNRGQGQTSLLLECLRLG
jgi:hypothetical protein